MESLKLINYHETRDFSRKMTATFEFVRQNFRSLGKSILILAGPPVLLASLLLGSFMGDFFGASMNAATDTAAFQNLFLSGSFWLQMVAMCVFLIVSSVVTISTINNYILLYEEKKTNRIEVADVWERVRGTFGMYLGTGVMMTILAIALYLVALIPVVLLGIASPVLTFFGVIGLVVLVLYLVVSTSMVFIIRAYERIGFFDALFRSIKLVQGKWWSTFGLLFVLYLIAAAVSYIFMVPWYVMLIVSTLHETGVEGFGNPGDSGRTLMLVFFTLYYLAQMILYTLPHVGVAFQYFNLVERKEARGLLSQIETIGQPSAPASNTEEHY